MHSQLEGYRSGFLDMKEEATDIVTGANTDALRAHPDPDAWTVVQCFDHLTATGGLLVESVKDAIRRGQAEGPYGEPPFEYVFLSCWFVRSMKPSSNWTFPAPVAYHPKDSGALDPDETVDEFCSLRDQFSECVAAAEGLNLRRLRLSSPAISLLRLSLGAWFEITLAHERRHLDQARRPLEAITTA